MITALVVPLATSARRCDSVSARRNSAVIWRASVRAFSRECISDQVSPAPSMLRIPPHTRTTSGQCRLLTASNSLRVLSNRVHGWA